MLRRHFLAAATLVVFASGPAPAQTPGSPPAGYPADYPALIEASRQEKDLVVYSNLQLSNWKDALEGFKALYPWIEVKIVDLGAETFERYYAESASGGRGADLIVSGGADSWVEFVHKDGPLPYVSPEASGLPAWSMPYPGVYTLATDPAVLVYNKRVIAEKDAPTSLHAVADLLARRPELKNRLSTQSVAVPFGRAAQWAWVQHNPDAWQVFDRLGPASRPERAVGTIIEKITTGEYALAWFVNASALFDKLRDPARRSLIGWSFIADGTPLVPRRLAVPRTARHAASARLLLDYLVSRPGQVAMGRTGVTAYRADVRKSDVLDYTYDAIVAEAGAAGIALERDDAAYAKGRDAFVERWRQSFATSK